MQCLQSSNYLKLLFIKSLQQVLGDDFIEPLLQGKKLCLNTTQETPVDIKPDILLLRVLCDGDALPIGLQLMLHNLSISIVFNTKGVVQHTCDVIVPKEKANVTCIIIYKTLK